MSDEATEVLEDGETVTVDTETGEILDETVPEPSEPETEDEPAEPVEPDEEAPAAEPPASAIRTPEDAKKFQQDIAKLRKDVAGRVGRIYAEDAVDLIECPLCAMDAPGYFVSPDKRPLHEEQVSFFRALLNMPVPTEYKQADAFQACPYCDGLGRVRTGSQVQNHEIAECPRCFSKGYVATAVGPVPVNGNANEQSADLTTGPTVYGLETVAIDEGTQAVIESLKDRGFMVIEPLQAPRPAV